MLFLFFTTGDAIFFFYNFRMLLEQCYIYIHPLTLLLLWPNQNKLFSRLFGWHFEQIKLYWIGPRGENLGLQNNAHFSGLFSRELENWVQFGPSVDPSWNANIGPSNNQLVELMAQVLDGVDFFFSFFFFYKIEILL